MTIVNPPPIKVPESIAKDLSEEGFGFLEELVFMIFQLWKRTGAGTDIIETSHVFSTGNEGLNAAAIGELEKRLNNLQDGDDFSTIARIDALEKNNIIDFPVNLLANVDKLQKDVKHLNSQAQIPDSFMGAKIDKLFKDLHNLQNSSQPTLLMGFIDSLTKTNSQQDSQIADLISTNALMSAYADQLLTLATVVDVSVVGTYTQTKFDDGIFCDATSGDFTVTMIDPALALKRRVVVRNETGSASTITVAATTGTVEVTTLNDTESVIFAPRPGAWISV